jgi:2,3-bisphosphoglycerate-independent phosphoglycerate mutase
MKYIVLIGDGMAGWPLEELGGKTVLQAASTPNMDRLARRGVRGMVRTIPKGMSPGSDVANMSILGYDPAKLYSGRAPLEAASIGVELEEGDVAFRCNLVTFKHDKKKKHALMEDHSSGHITTEEAHELVKALSAELGGDDIVFYPGVSYRQLMIWKVGEVGVECTPPHDIIGKDISDYQPVGAGSDRLRELMLRSVDILENHEINKRRVAEGKNPASSIWLWGQGGKPKLPLFTEKYGVSGALVSAVDLTKGLGIYAGFRILDVPGVTGYIDTNYVGKAEHSLKALEDVDFVYIHVEAPDEAGHSGNVKDKIQAVEDFDEKVVGTMLRGLESFDEYRILLMPDHATPIKLRTHSDEPVPFVVYDSTDIREGGEDITYDENISREPEVLTIEHGHELMDYFIKGKQ